MSEEKDRPKKTLADRAKEFVQDVLETIEELLPTPEPQLVPIPVGRPRRR